MAILNKPELTATMIARISTLEQLPMSEKDMYEFFNARHAEQQQVLDSGMAPNPEAQKQLIFELRECARFVYLGLMRNEQLRLENLTAMQYSVEASATTVGELMDMLSTLQSKWDEGDVEFLGEFKDMPLCVGSRKGITKSNFKLVAEHGLVAFDSPRIAL